MAGGKLSPRQKMINMMYLVLTALLALNISKDILDALTKLQYDLESSASAIHRSSEKIYTDFMLAAEENPERAGQWRDRALEVQAVSNETFDFIENIKTELVALHGEIDEDGKLPGADKREKAANYLLNPEKMGGADGGRKMREQLNKFREKLKGMVDNNPSLAKTLDKEFDTSPQPIGKNSVATAEWEKVLFDHVPLAGVMTFLSSYQSKVRSAEASVITELQKQIDAGTLKFTGVKEVVVPKSTYVTTGDTFKAEVFLAAFDDTQDPEIVLYEYDRDSNRIGEGITLSGDQIKNGAGFISFPANQTGERFWGGVIRIGSGETAVERSFIQSYTVAPPSAVISPTKMNVLYRGVDNPLEISVPGVDPSQLEVSGPGVSRQGDGTYIADVTKVKGTEIDINVSVKGKPFRQSKKFRIKGLPPATGMVLKNRSTIYSKNAVKNATIEAEYKDFAFDLNLQVLSFDVVIPGFPPQTIRGTRFDDGVKKRIDALRPGSTVVVRNIKAKGPKGINVTDISDVVFDVN